MVEINKEVESAILSMYNLLGKQQQLEKKNQLQEVITDHCRLVLKLIKQKHADILCLPERPSNSDVIQHIHGLVEQKFSRISATFSPDRAIDGDKFEIAKYLLLLFYELTITRDEVTLKRTIASLDQEGTGNHSITFAQVIQTLTNRIDDIDDCCWREMLCSDVTEEESSVTRPASSPNSRRATGLLSRFSFRTPRTPSKLSGSSSSPIESPSMQQFVSSPLLREKRFARENQELRKKIDDLEDTNNETEMRYKSVVAEMDTMETKLKLAKSRNDDLQKQLQYKSTALENNESALNDLKKRHEYQASDVSTWKMDYHKALRTIEEKETTIKGLEQDKELYMAQLKTYGEKFRDADAEIEELTTKMRALEKYKRLFEEKEDELQNLIAENTSDRRARQLDAEKKEQQYLEDFRQQEKAMRDLKEKLDSSEQLHIEQMQLMEMERKKEREARDSLQEQIKKLEAFNMQLKQMKDNIKEGETLETARLIDENTALRRQVTDLQEREHILQTHLFDHQHLIGELRKEILALEEQCQKFETWNRQLKASLEKSLAIEEQSKAQFEQILALTRSFDKLEEEKHRLETKLVAEEKKYCDVFFQFNNNRNEIEARKKENEALLEENQKLTKQLQQANTTTFNTQQLKEIKEDLERKLRDARFQSDEYIARLMETHEKEKNELLEEIETQKRLSIFRPSAMVDENTAPLGEPILSPTSKAIENEVEPRSRRAISTRNRSLAVFPSNAPRELNYTQDKYSRLRDLASRNTIAQPHLKESYFLETNSPNSEAILRGNAMVKHEPITPKHH